MAADDEKPNFRQRLKQFGQAFNHTRRNDSRLIPYLLGVFLVPVIIGVVVSVITGLWMSALPLGILVGLLLAMLLFTRRATKAMYNEVEGMPGAGAAVLQNMRGDWRITPAVQVNPQQDMVHRVLGRPGVVLVGEGSPARVFKLMNNETKRIARVTGGVEIYRVLVGDDEDQIAIPKLQGHLNKLPRNLSGKQVNALETRMVAIQRANLGAPKGPMPKGARMPKGAKMPRG